MAKIKMKNSVTVAETFHDFLTGKKAAGVSEKTLLTYGQHFSAVSKHLSPDTPMDALNKADLETMIASMRDAGLAANSIKSYTRTLKSFFSWCNEAGITRLNIQLYKAEETIKETYSDEELKKLLKKPNMKKCTFGSVIDTEIDLPQSRGISRTPGFQYGGRIVEWVRLLHRS